MIWSIVCEWNYSSWCVVFWVWITSRIENCFFLSGKQNSVRNVSENVEVFRLFRWTFVNSCFYLPIFVGVELLSEHKDHEKKHHHHSSSTSNSMQVFMQWLDLVISTINKQQHFISNQHSTCWTTTTIKFDSIGLSYKNIKNYNIIDKIVFYRLDHSTFIKWRRDVKQNTERKNKPTKAHQWNCEIFVIIVE